MGPTLASLAEDLAAGRTSALALTEACLRAIEAPAGQGGTAFVYVARDEALAAAERSDALRAAGRARSRFEGIPISIKDLFDIAGQPTRAGSVVLGDQPAASDAAAVARLRAAGFVIIGRTNMTEFAFSGLGLNPHYGTPLSPWHREEQRIAGGSTSGGAVSVADGMAHAALGTDTGGSCRIPAAWCGLAGFKPTASRVPSQGAIPLSTTLDSIGPIARSASCCAALDAILSGEDEHRKLPSLNAARFAAIETYVLEDLEPEVAHAYERALAALEAAGATVDRVEVPALERIPQINAKGGFAASEAWTFHRERIEADEARYDPRVAVRIRRGASQTEEDVAELKRARRQLISEVEAITGGYDAMLMPTVPILPPRLEDLARDEDYGRINLLALRNPAVINLLDGCAISLPVGGLDGPPVGLMLAAPAGEDRRLLALAEAVEEALRT
jgi:aspartyl-tRNA(Asn)/glutamyl-tRNA(Gln) amidotransferase subunit A